MKPRSTERRRVKLIKPRMQLRLTGFFLGLSGLGFLLQSLHLSMRLAQVASNLPNDGPLLSSMLPGLPLEVLLFSFAMLLPLTTAVGILVTFRIAGPAYRLEQYLKSVKRGEQLGPCRLRAGDDLQELCELVNEVTAPLRQGRGATAPRADGPADAEAQEGLVDEEAVARTG